MGNCCVKTVVKPVSPVKGLVKITTCVSYSSQDTPQSPCYEKSQNKSYPGWI